MSDIFREVDEDIRRDKLVSFWQRYGGAVVASAVLIVVGTAGYVGWKHWRTGQMEERTAVLSTALSKIRPEQNAAPVDTKAGADALAQAAQQLGGGHATIARLYEAGLRARDGQRDQAIALYDSLAGDSEATPLLRDLALLMSIQLQVDTGDIAALQGRLAPLLATGNAWRASAAELAGLLAIRSGDNARAAELFRGLAEDADAPQGVRARATELAAFYAAPK